MEGALAYLDSMAEQPVAIFFGLLLLSFLLEDLAAIGAAIIAAQHPELLPTTFSAILIGILVGDIGLYLIGRWASTHPKVENWLYRKGVKHINHWLHENLFRMVLIARMIPGLRFTTYTACGLFKIPAGKFMVYVVAFVCVWTTILFVATLQISDFLETYSQYRHSVWVLIPAAFLLMLMARSIFTFQVPEDEDAAANDSATPKE